MKVDLVVNSMIQQLDRNLQMQIMPVLAFRAGEILHGRVMLDAGDKPQIRLDSGELLSALPSGDVQLFAGATVTLRVTGNMDGQFVMQLLEQELSGRTAAGQTPEAAGEPLTRLMGNTQQGRAVLAAMETMRVPPREETARQAMTILGAFPGLKAEKAVFLAANGITPTDAAVNALNALIDDGATTGGELMKFADMLAGQALDAEGTGAKAPAQSAPAAGGIAAQAATAAGISTQSALPQGDAMLQLQSLIFVGLGMDAAEQYSAITSALGKLGMAPDAVRLALDGSMAADQEFEARLAAFTAALPEGEGGEARAFLTRLAGGLKSQAEAAALAMPGVAEPAPQGLQRVVREVMDLFVKLEGDSAANTKELQGATKLTHETAQRLSAELADTGAAGAATAQQLNRVENHIRLLDNITQYAYQQIPVAMNGRNRTVELYVMNRGGSGKKINPEKASILIALETENMGHLEALISVSSKNLRLRFGVDKPELAGYVNSFTGEISRAMQGIGYKLSDVRMQVTGAPVTPLSAIAEAESWQDSPMRLDIKL